MVEEEWLSDAKRRNSWLDGGTLGYKFGRVLSFFLRLAGLKDIALSKDAMFDHLLEFYRGLSEEEKMCCYAFRRYHVSNGGTMRIGLVVAGPISLKYCIYGIWIFTWKNEKEIRLGEITKTLSLTYPKRSYEIAFQFVKEGKKGEFSVEKEEIYENWNEFRLQLTEESWDEFVSTVRKNFKVEEKIIRMF